MVLNGTHLNSWTDMSNVEIAPHRLVNSCCTIPDFPSVQQLKGDAQHNSSPEDTSCKELWYIPWPLWSNTNISPILTMTLCSVMLLLKMQHVNDFTQKHFHGKKWVNIWIASTWIRDKNVKQVVGKHKYDSKKHQWHAPVSTLHASTSETLLNTDKLGHE